MFTYLISYSKVYQKSNSIDEINELSGVVFNFYGSKHLKLIFGLELFLN